MRSKRERDSSSIPATPESNYICQNCGMLIESTHRHTREECGIYDNAATKPDLRAHRTILQARNDPKIRLPYYYDSLYQKVIT